MPTKCTDTYLNELERIKQMPESDLRSYAAHVLALHANASQDESSAGGCMWDDESCICEADFQCALDIVNRVQHRRREDFRAIEADWDRYEDQVFIVRRALEKRMEALPEHAGTPRSFPEGRSQLEELSWQDLISLIDAKQNESNVRNLAHELVRRLSIRDQDATQFIMDLGLTLGVER